MSTIRVVPEAHLVLDPLTSLLAAEREDVIEYSMEPIMVQISELEMIADDLVNSLAPDRPLMNSFPGREKTSMQAGFYTNVFYGMIIGLGVAGLLLIVLSAIGGV